MVSKKEKSTDKKFTYKYVIPDHLRDLYANGIWGGVTPRGEFNLHFYNERYALPNSVTCKVKDGQIGEAIDHKKGGDAVRMIQASIIMDYPVAVALRDWLNERIEVVDKAKEREK